MYVYVTYIKHDLIQLLYICLYFGGQSWEVVPQVMKHFIMAWGKCCPVVIHDDNHMAALLHLFPLMVTPLFCNFVFVCFELRLTIALAYTVLRKCYNKLTVAPNTAIICNIKPYFTQINLTPKTVKQLITYKSK